MKNHFKMMFQSHCHHLSQRDFQSNLKTPSYLCILEDPSDSSCLIYLD